VPQLYNNLCVLFRNMKKFDDSRKAALQCLAALPRYAPALNNLALLQVTVGQLTDADGNLRASMDADQALTCAQSNAASLQVLFRTFLIVWFAQFCVFVGNCVSSALHSKVIFTSFGCSFCLRRNCVNASYCAFKVLAGE
jgi:hypothetical protein